MQYTELKVLRRGGSRGAWWAWARRCSVWKAKASRTRLREAALEKDAIYHAVVIELREEGKLGTPANRRQRRPGFSDSRALPCYWNRAASREATRDGYAIINDGMPLRSSRLSRLATSG